MLDYFLKDEMKKENLKEYEMVARFCTPHNALLGCLECWAALVT